MTTPKIKLCPFCGTEPVFQELSWGKRYLIRHAETCFMKLGCIDKIDIIFLRKATADCPISGDEEIKAWNTRKGDGK